MTRPDILFIMTDQQRFDTIAALGNSHVHTPNLDRLVRRGIAFSNAYATCPVCVAARYTIRTGCEPPTTRVFSNAKADPVAGQPPEIEARLDADEIVLAAYFLRRYVTYCARRRAFAAMSDAAALLRRLQR